MPNADPSNEPISQRNKKVNLPSKVAQYYFRHGLVLSTYPTCCVSLGILIVLFCCYPLSHIPLPGTVPTKITLPYSEENESQSFLTPNFNSIFNNFTFEPPFPPWARSEPFVFIQQIIFKSSVPWNDDMILTDAFRGPLYEVFKLLELVRNHQDEKSKKTLGHICLHVENVKRPTRDVVFPEYNCLILSPANFWKNPQNFNRDTNLLNTIFSYQNLQKTKVSTAEMLFGMHLRETGIKRYPIRARPRIIQYAITLFLRENDKNYLQSLKLKLINKYSLHQKFEKPQRASVVYIYYPGEFNIMEFLPLFIAFVSLFIYVYFSLRKIEIIKSRVILAMSAVITVLGSLGMSLGLCFFFGLTIGVQSKGIYPYLVIIIGLENVLVITKSVVTTDETLDIKIRVAQGLRKEGWSISKNLFTEITILTIGLATFVPVIQEFCIFAIVGLISDFFLQMIFFSTILAMDIKRVEYNAEVRNLPKNSRIKYAPIPYVGMNRSRSHPRLNNLDGISLRTDIPLTGQKIQIEKKLPKRLRLFNFWARTRFFQRSFMIWMLVWISTIIYNSGIIEHFFLMENHNKTVQVNYNSNFKVDELNQTEPIIDTTRFDENFLLNQTEQINKLKHREYETSYGLTTLHWSAILKQYNISLSGKYVTILPTIKISHIIPSDNCIQLRNPDEKSPQHFQWKAFAAALDPIDFSDVDYQEPIMTNPENIPLYPKSPMEIFLALILCTISVFVLAYTMVVIYRCICSKNYAEWRASWNDQESIPLETQQILETVPIKAKGHIHCVECIAADGNMVASSCLEGQIKIWDATTGNNIANIDRFRKLIPYYATPIQGERKASVQTSTSPIWCLDYLDNLLCIGCADGRLEFWEGITGKFKCVYEADATYKNGVTHIKLTGDKVVAGRLGGQVDILRLETYARGVPIDYNFSSAYRRTHIRTGSTGSNLTNRYSPLTPNEEELRCVLEKQHHGYHQRITCLDVYDGIICTGSQDLKVFQLDTAELLHTLHEHRQWTVTSLFIDHCERGTGVSGLQDGRLFVWDLIKGFCTYEIKAHDGAILSLACAHSYVISLGLDKRLCIWERFLGNLLNTINVSQAYASLLMLTPSLLVTAKPGSLIVWDVRTGQQAREVKLDETNVQFSPKKMLILPDCKSVVCDFGNQLRIVRFPQLANDKCE